MDGIETWKSTETICESAGSEQIYAQVDGEPVGPLPIAFRIVPDALSIVTPEVC
jgi:diacylglycerol kinase family enzyme